MMRHRIALIGVFAVLLQAVLFGWHHHPVRFATGERWPMLSSPSSSAPLSPGAAEDECELCAALHYLTAAPAEIILAALPPAAASVSLPAETIRLNRCGALAFRARAPPLA